MESESDSIPLDSKKRSRQISSQPHTTTRDFSISVISRLVKYDV